jgi:hypothetical protein
MYYLTQRISHAKFQDTTQNSVATATTSLFFGGGGCGTATQRGSWPPHAPQSVELLWTSDQLVAETST